MPSTFATNRHGIHMTDTVKPPNDDDDDDDDDQYGDSSQAWLAGCGSTQCPSFGQNSQKNCHVTLNIPPSTDENGLIYVNKQLTWYKDAHLGLFRFVSFDDLPMNTSYFPCFLHDVPLFSTYFPLFLHDFPLVSMIFHYFAWFSTYFPWFSMICPWKLAIFHGWQPWFFLPATRSPSTRPTTRIPSCAWSWASGSPFARPRGPRAQEVSINGGYPISMGLFFLDLWMGFRLDVFFFVGTWKTYGNHNGNYNWSGIMMGFWDDDDGIAYRGFHSHWWYPIKWMVLFQGKSENGWWPGVALWRNGNHMVWEAWWFWWMMHWLDAKMRDSWDDFIGL